MCFGPTPQAPQIVYKGPSEADIKANQEALDKYQAQMQQQQTDFQSALQLQIDQANEEAADLEKRYSSELSSLKEGYGADQDKLSAQQAAEAATAGALNSNSAYAVTASQSTPAQSGQTTQAIKKKEKPKSNLKISTAALPSSGGTGLNIGV